jgi:hypothetical protein
VFFCVARRFIARASFMFAGCCCCRSLVIDGSSGASRGHVPAARRPGARRSGAVTTFAFQAGRIPKSPCEVRVFVCCRPLTFAVGCIIGCTAALMVFKRICASRPTAAATCVIGIRGYPAEKDHPAYIPRRSSGAPGCCVVPSGYVVDQVITVKSRGMRAEAPETDHQFGSLRLARSRSASFMTRWEE